MCVDRVWLWVVRVCACVTSVCVDMACVCGQGVHSLCSINVGARAVLWVCVCVCVWGGGGVHIYVYILVDLYHPHKK